MKNKYLAWCGLLILAILILTVVAYPQLPALIPVHWDAQGQINLNSSVTIKKTMPNSMLARVSEVFRETPNG